MGKEKALVVCPGRGTYNTEELGYLSRHHAARDALIEHFDAYREGCGQTTLSDLDGRETYDRRVHTRGDNASPLIFACAYFDYLSIDRRRFDVVAATGNSMGWYIALGCAGALSQAHTLELINTMGSLMHEALIGGQLIYPLVDERWQPIPGRRAELMDTMRGVNGEPECELYVSIELGGMLVFGGNERALDALQKHLPAEQDKFPLRLFNHAAFHTGLQRPISERARQAVDAGAFHRPTIPLVDGRGHIWSPYSTDPARLWEYTLGHQVVEPYDFTTAVQVAVKEFAPQRIIVLGPGKTLGASVAQSLIAIGWQGLGSKADFVEQQENNAFLLSMGMHEQRALVDPSSGAEYQT